MAIGWLSVLKMVPWDDVISNAPKVTDGAKKLWSAVAKKSPETELPSANAQQPAPSSEAKSITDLQAQLASLAAELADLQHQMLESTELIRALADQSAQLIKRVETNRIRVLWLASTLAVLGIIAAVNLAITLTP